MIPQLHLALFAIPGILVQNVATMSSGHLGHPIIFVYMKSMVITHLPSATRNAKLDIVMHTDALGVV